MIGGVIHVCKAVAAAIKFSPYCCTFSNCICICSRITSFVGYCLQFLCMKVNSEMLFSNSAIAKVSRLIGELRMRFRLRIRFICCSKSTTSESSARMLSLLIILMVAFSTCNSAGKFTAAVAPQIVNKVKNFILKKHLRIWAERVKQAGKTRKLLTCVWVIRLGNWYCPIEQCVYGLHVSSLY